MTVAAEDVSADNKAINQLQEKLGIEEASNLFADETPEWNPFEDSGEEEAVEDAEESTDDSEKASEEVEEETEEESSEEDDNDPDSEEESEEESETNFEEVATNLKKAVHAERTKRKEATELATQYAEQVTLAQNDATAANEAYLKLVEVIKDNGLEDLVEVPKIEPVSQEVLEARQMKAEKEQQAVLDKFYTDAKLEAESLAPEFKNVDLNDAEQGAYLTELITMNGYKMPTGEAVKAAMETMDKLIATVTEKQKKARQPAVKVKTKQKARTRKASPSSTQQKVKDGDFRGVFDAIGKRMSGE
mgnify:CR=1 FL=1